MNGDANSAQPGDLERLASAHFTHPPTEAEIKLLRAAPRSEFAKCCPDGLANDPSNANQWGKEREIRADLIRWLCVDTGASALVASEGLQVIGAKISGTLDLSFVIVPFPLAFVGCRLDVVVLRGTEIPDLNLQFTSLHSIDADGATVKQNLFLRRGFRAEGEVRLLGARIHGVLDCSKASLGSADHLEGIPAGAALSLDGAAVEGGVFLNDGFEAHGEVRLLNAQIGGDLTCSGSGVDAPRERAEEGACALGADGVVVEGTVHLDGFSAEGGIRFLGAQIAGDLDCTGAAFTNKAQHGSSGMVAAFAADGAVIKGAVFFRDGFRAEGDVEFVGAHVHKSLECIGCTFQGCLNIEGAQIEHALVWRRIRNPKAATLVLANATTSRLLDDGESWPAPGNMELDGFRYGRISEGPRDAETRLTWLGLVGHFARQPYRQFAKVLREEGDDAGARKVLYEMERKRRGQEDRNGFERFWSGVLRYSIGYGYYPRLALLWLLGLATVGFALFCSGYYAGSMVPTDKDVYNAFRADRSLPDHYGRFHASIYSLENSFPLVKLGQVDKWQPDPGSRGAANVGESYAARFVHLFVSSGFLRWFHWIQILLGWFFATMGIASVTGLARED